MNLVDVLTKNNNLVSQLSKQFNLGQDQSQSAISILSKALASKNKKNTSNPSGLNALLGALQKGNHQRYIEQPHVLEREESTQEGNGILKHILGSKDVSRRVAQKASVQTGIGESVLKKMLPLIAGAAMGNLSKHSSELGISSNSLNPQQSAGGLLSFLDGDKDGSIMDDLLGFLKQ